MQVDVCIDRSMTHSDTTVAPDDPARRKKDPLRPSSWLELLIEEEEGREGEGVVSKLPGAGIPENGL